MAIPLFDNQPTRRTPVMTYLLIAANIVIFLITPMSNLGQDDSVSERERRCDVIMFEREYGAIPKELTTGDQQPTPPRLAEICEAKSFEKSPFLSSITSMFLHGDTLHLFGNMLMLFVFGMGVEDRLGRLRFLLFYLVAGIAATYGFALGDPDLLTPLVGASGAIAGVMGAYLVFNPRGRIWTLMLGFIPFRLAAWVVLGFWLVYEQVVLGQEQEDSGVAVLAHIVGFLVGAAFAWFVRRTRATSRDSVLAGRD